MHLLPILERVSHRNKSARSWFQESPDWHIVDVDDQAYLFVADGSRLYRIDRDAQCILSNAKMGKDERYLVLASLGIPIVHAIKDDPPVAVPMRSLSLAISQKCNLGCTYCYAEGGSFGGVAKNMPLEVALRAVDCLITEAQPGERVNLAFLGGEPLVNRDVLRSATLAARRLAEQKGVRLGLSVTTNGTLITEDDGEFFEQHGFAVTISLDGIGEVHDRQRSFHNGRGSYDRIIERVTPLLNRQRKAQISARVTVTPRNLSLVETLHKLIELGFHSVGFSPMLSSPTGCDEMGSVELQEMLRQMIDCGREFERRVVAGERFPFSNMVNAMKEIHQGTHRPYPCGAGGGYFGVSADGNLFACHRFVDDPVGAMGDLEHGVDPNRQAAWLANRHVHFQEPCSSCWARYLCGGGCHHEVIRRGRPACDYIRGWLHYCLQAYVRLLDQHPDYFSSDLAVQRGLDAR